jgi:hypothetical protein
MAAPSQVVMPGPVPGIFGRSTAPLSHEMAGTGPAMTTLKGAA